MTRARRGAEYAQVTETAGWRATCEHDSEVISPTVLALDRRIDSGEAHARVPGASGEQQT